MEAFLSDKILTSCLSYGIGRQDEERGKTKGLVLPTWDHKYFVRASKMSLKMDKRLMKRDVVLKERRGVR